MEELFKNHKVSDIIHPYGHGMPCPHSAKQTQFPHRRRLAAPTSPHYAKQTQSPGLPVPPLRKTNPITAAPCHEFADFAVDRAGRAA